MRRVTDSRVLGATRPPWKALPRKAVSRQAPGWGRLALLAFGLSGCGLTMPFERAPAAGGDAQLVTGSIAPQRPPPAAQASLLSPQLDQEDWRRAVAALATALDPQGNGAVVRWDNADSGRKGSFAPVGDPFLVKDEICRAFIASVAADGSEKRLPGSACRSGPSTWTIRDAKDWKRPD